MVVDPISDFINRLKNAQAVGHEQVVVSFSKMKAAVAEKLVSRGFIAGTEKKTVDGKEVLEVTLAYSQGGAPKIRGTERVSKPGRRLYSGAKTIKPVLQGRGVLLVSTPQGVLTDDEARKAGVGGELLCKVW